MAKLRVPTLQHLARNYKDDPARICKDLVRLAVNPPNFSYELLFKLAREMLVLRPSYDDLLQVVERVKRPDLRAKFLEVLPLLHAHFDGQDPDYFQDIEPRMYSVGRGLMVPFAPPFIYGVSGRITFPWISLWRTNPLSDDRLSLFVTIVEQVLLDDPDLEQAKFEIVDFSASTAKAEREIHVIDAADIPRISDSRVREMLSTFAEGFFQAQKILAEMPAAPGRGAKGGPAVDPAQEELFGDDEPPS